MRTASPATRPPHAAAHFIKANCYPTASRFILLGRYNPANPLITCKRRDIRPHILHFRITLDCFGKIHRHFVHRAIGNFFGHNFLNSFWRGWDNSVVNGDSPAP